jgi:putative transcriptional regulator
MKPSEIKEIRDNLGITQADLANLVGVTVHAVRKWEQGQRCPGGAATKIMRELQTAKS